MFSVKCLMLLRPLSLPPSLPPFPFPPSLISLLKKGNGMRVCRLLAFLPSIKKPRKGVARWRKGGREGGRETPHTHNNDMARHTALTHYRWFPNSELARTPKVWPPPPILYQRFTKSSLKGVINSSNVSKAFNGCKTFNSNAYSLGCKKPRPGQRITL